MVHVVEVSKLVNECVDERGVSKDATGTSVDETNADAPIIEAEAVPVTGISAIGVEVVRRKAELFSHSRRIGSEPSDEVAVVVYHESALGPRRTSESHRQPRSLALRHQGRCISPRLRRDEGQAARDLAARARPSRGARWPGGGSWPVCGGP